MCLSYWPFHTLQTTMKFKYEILNGSGCASSPDNDTDDDLKTCGKCKLCELNLNTSTGFKSTVTNEKNCLPKDNFGIKIACTTKNVVYLITCDFCNMQYVGMTTTELRKRFDSHRSALNTSKFNTELYYHFLTHKKEHLKVQIIYHYNKTDDAKEVLLTVEEFYMRKLCTLMPFGLNDNINSMNINLSSYDLLKLNSRNTPFFTFPSERKKRGHGHKKYHKRNVDSSVLKENVDKMYAFLVSFKMHELYVYLRSLKRNTINECLEILDDYCENHPAKRSSLHRMLLSYRSQFVKPPKKEDDSFIYCTIPYVHRVIESMGIRGILKSKDLNAYLPHISRKFKIRTTFSYSTTVGRRILNYNKVLNKLTKEDLTVSSCDCNSKYAKFVYAPHGHVHTGQLDIIDNLDLRRIMAMGAKFRLTPSVTKAKIWNSLSESMIKLKKKFSRKCKIKEECFDIWFDILMKKIKKRFHTFRNFELESNDIFEQDSVVQYLKDFQERFVIVPVDKASNNYAIICKIFYIQILKEELGILNNKDITGNTVYQPVYLSEEKFYQQQELKNKQLGNTLTEENKYIPLLYWTSKQHKNPYKFRFIAGASHCTNKTISQEVSLALKCIKNQFKNYCGVIKKRTGLNYYWCIDNSAEFLQKLSDVDTASSIETFDFSTLYTNLPLDCIYDNFERLIIKMFKNSGSNSILVL